MTTKREQIYDFTEKYQSNKLVISFDKGIFSQFKPEVQELIEILKETQTIVDSLIFESEEIYAINMPELQEFPELFFGKQWIQSIAGDTTGTMLSPTWGQDYPQPMQKPSELEGQFCDPKMYLDKEFNIQIDIEQSKCKILTLTKRGNLDYIDFPKYDYPKVYDFMKFPIWEYLRKLDLKLEIKKRIAQESARSEKINKHYDSDLSEWLE